MDVVSVQRLGLLCPLTRRQDTLAVFSRPFDRSSAGLFVLDPFILDRASPSASPSVALLAVGEASRALLGLDQVPDEQVRVLIAEAPTLRESRRKSI